LISADVLAAGACVIGRPKFVEHAGWRFARNLAQNHFEALIIRCGRAMSLPKLQSESVHGALCRLRDALVSSAARSLRVIDTIAMATLATTSLRT
jgi:hypothetical protein